MFLVTIKEVYIDVIIPNDNAIANPLIGPAPIKNRINAINNDVIFASIILDKALLNPLFVITFIFEFTADSSLILSNIKIYESMLIPIVKIIPAIPDNVSVTFNIDIILIINVIFIIKAIVDISPSFLYLIIMNRVIIINESINDFTLFLILSSPNDGPIIFSSIIDNVVGSDPDLNSNARFLDS